MKAVAALCLLGAAGIWAWALLWPKPPEPLPDTYVGTFVQSGFEPPIDKAGERVSMPNPYPPGQTRRWIFRADGTYTMSVVVIGGFEMMRHEGTIRYSEQDGLIEMRQLSENLKRSEEPLRFRYAPRWGQDNQGRFLLLIGELETEEEKARLKQGSELYLRPSVASERSD